MVDTGGQARHPAATEHLMEFWSHGEGGTEEIRWFEPGAFERCKVSLAKYVPDEAEREGLCSNLGKRATGFRPGSKEYNQLHGHGS